MRRRHIRVDDGLEPFFAFASARRRFESSDDRRQSRFACFRDQLIFGIEMPVKTAM
jgi:hypothetical protein